MSTLRRLRVLMVGRSPTAWAPPFRPGDARAPLSLVGLATQLPGRFAGLSRRSVDPLIIRDLKLSANYSQMRIQSNIPEQAQVHPKVIVQNCPEVID